MNETTLTARGSWPSGPTNFLFFIFLYMLFYIIKLFRSITSKRVVLVYSLVQSSPSGLVQYNALVVHSYYLYYTHIQPIGGSLLYSVIHTKYTYIYRLFSLSLSHFIFLTWHQSHCSDILVPVVIFGFLLLPLLSSSSHYQKRVTTVTPIVPVTLGSHRSVHQTAKAKAYCDRTANLEQNPTKNSHRGQDTCRLKLLTIEHTLHVSLTFDQK